MESMATGVSFGCTRGNTRSNWRFSAMARPPVNRLYVSDSSLTWPGRHIGTWSPGRPGVRRKAISASRT